MWFRRLFPAFLILFMLFAFLGCAFGAYLQPQDVFSIVMLTFLFGMASFGCYLFGFDTPYDDYRPNRR